LRTANRCSASTAIGLTDQIRGGQGDYLGDLSSAQIQAPHCVRRELGFVGAERRGERARGGEEFWRWTTRKRGAA